MRITLDRNYCQRWQASCESCFASRLTQNNFDVADCCLAAVPDGREALEFRIHDRDGQLRTLTVNDQNWADAYDSWLLLWRAQAGLAA
jgi:hypothetical protein